VLNHGFDIKDTLNSVASQPGAIASTAISTKSNKQVMSNQAWKTVPKSPVKETDSENDYRSTPIEIDPKEITK